MIETLKIGTKNWSRLVFGGAALSGKGYGFGDASFDEAIDLLKYAYSEGINVFDTAPIYGMGESELRLGEALKNQRDKVIFISKAGVTWHSNGRVNMTNDPNIVLKMFDESRHRLQSDYIDLYMIHWPDPRVDIRFALEPLYKLKQRGQIHHIGLCNTNPEDLSRAQEIDFLQSEFNLLRNGFANIEVAGIKTMGWGTLDKGILSGSVEEDSRFPSQDCRSWAPWWKKSDWKERVRELKKQNLTKPQLLRTAIQHSWQHCNFTLIGMRTKAYIDSAVACL